MKTIQVCENCGKPECDGRVFKPEGTRLVCKGKDGRDVDEKKMRYLYTMGYGQSWWVPMVEVAA
jgi:hypothetical protein